MSKEITVSACIVTYNNEDCIFDAVDTVTKNTKGVNLDLYVCDNNSADNTLGKIEDIDSLKVIRLGKNGGFGFAHNAVLDKINSKYHVVINPDIKLDSDAITHIVQYMEQNESVVMATPKIMNPDLTEQHLPKKTPSFKYLFLGRIGSVFGSFKKYRTEYTRANENLTDATEVDFCTGCFFVIRTKVFKDLGGFDERFFMYFEDADITRRAKRFGKTMFLPFVSVTHVWERASSKKLKYLFIHLVSYFKYMLKWRKRQYENNDNRL